MGKDMAAGTDIVEGFAVLVVAVVVAEVAEAEEAYSTMAEAAYTSFYANTYTTT